MPDLLARALGLFWCFLGFHRWGFVEHIDALWFVHCDRCEHGVHVRNDCKCCSQVARVKRAMSA